MGLLGAIFGRAVPGNSAEHAAVDLLIDHGDGLPLLRLIAGGQISWVTPPGRRAYSGGGRLTVEDDMYFYLHAKRGLSVYVTYNLCGREMSEMLECAAINASKLGRAVDNYTEYLAAHPGEA